MKAPYGAFFLQRKMKNKKIRVISVIILCSVIVASIRFSKMSFCNRKAEITLLTSDPTPYTQAVQEFNSLNSNYEVIIQNYQSNSLPPQELSNYIRTVNIDLVDLSSLCYDFSNQGILDDLVPYFEKDTDYSIDDLLPSVYSALLENEKLLCISPLFCVQTLCSNMNLDVAPCSGNISLRFSSNGEAQIPVISKEKFLSLAFGHNKIRMYSEEDISEILRFSCLLPENGVSLFAGTTEGALAFENLSGISAIRHRRVDFYNLNMINYGFPLCADNSGLLVPILNIGIYKLSECKAGAWEFIKYLLSDAFIEKHKLNLLPILKTQFASILEDDLRWLKDDGIIVTIRDQVEREIQITTSIDEEICTDLLSNLCGFYHPNNYLYNKIRITIAQFYNGDIDLNCASKTIYELIQEKQR